MPLIELGVGVQWPSTSDWQSISEQAAGAAIATTPYAPIVQKGFATEISVKLSDNEEVQKLNSDYRGKDRPTNVLSFPLVQPDLLNSLSNTDDGEILLGDIILAHDICKSEADEKSLLLEDHVSHLVVHGTLHLLGYDHDKEADALLMEDLEVKALATLGIADPYRENS